MQLCRKAAAAGPLQVALQWGNIQEAAALQLLTKLLPEALVCETGLHMVSQGMLPGGYALQGHAAPQQQPAPCGAAPTSSSKGAARRSPGSASGAAQQSSSGEAAPEGQLPMLGASPDALIRHQIVITAGALEALGPLLLQLQRAGPQADPSQVRAGCTVGLCWQATVP